LSVNTAIRLIGSVDVDTLNGSSANDVLDGRGGADIMSGRGGDDWYYVDNAGDLAFESAGEGANDRVFASVSYTLLGGSEIERLTTTDNAGTAAISLTGNAFANQIYGNAGANVLDGGGGVDTLVGLGGDDWYYVDNAGDTVTEGAGGGANDRVLASLSYTLGAGVQVERLTTDDNAGTGSINLTGNGLANDTLVGLGGDDSYYVDNAADVVSEGAGGGTGDRIFARVSYAMGAGVQVERLTTDNNAGTAAINLTGNELANAIYGNAGANVLDGKGGGDSLIGMTGADTFRFTTALGAGNVDTIIDYSVAADTIQLENAVFTGLAAGALAAGAFNTGAAATQADDRVIYNGATGALLFDVDGVGGLPAVQFGTLSTGLAMVAGEFVVI
jgi:serralysin